VEIKSLSAIIGMYFPERKLSGAKKIEHGLINRSYKVQLDNGEKYFLQKINSNVFPKPSLLDENLTRFFSFMESRWKQVQLSPLSLVQNITGSTLTHLDGEWWRVMNFIDKGTTIHIPKNKDQIKNSGKAYARLLSTMAEESPFGYHEIIPDFFNSRSRLDQLEKAAKANKVDRVEQCKQEIDTCLEFYSSLDFDSIGVTFDRLCINDCKISNVLFDRGLKNVKAIVDFDTVMKGSYYLDFADMVRAGCCSVPEDVQELDQVNFDQIRFSALVEGFWTNLMVEGFRIEREFIWLGIQNLMWQQYSRFLTDYINGDEYYQVEHSSHNLQRARVQSSLLFETSKLKSRLLLSLQTLLNP